MKIIVHLQLFNIAFTECGKSAPARIIHPTDIESGNGRNIRAPKVPREIRITNWKSLIDSADTSYHRFPTHQEHQWTILSQSWARPKRPSQERWTILVIVCSETWRVATKIAVDTRSNSLSLVHGHMVIIFCWEAKQRALVYNKLDCAKSNGGYSGTDEYLFTYRWRGGMMAAIDWDKERLRYWPSYQLTW